MIRYVSMLAIFAAVAAHAQERVEAHVPMRAITSGPVAHWFGYYDKHQFDPSDRYVLGMQVDFEGRTPTADDAIRLGMVDTQAGDHWIPIGESRAWGWQQGCMLQWLPGSDSEVIYNDRREGRFVSVIKDVFTGNERVLPIPIYSISPDGKLGVTPDYARIDATRPGYGYKGVADPYDDDRAPEGSGIWSVDLETGETNLIVTLAQIAAIPQEHEAAGAHWFNHLLFNPDGTRFIFLHRVRRQDPTSGGWITRMFTANSDGSDLHCLADHQMVSHFIWRDAKRILAWSTEPETGNRFHLYTDQSDEAEVIGEEVLTRDGHCTYSPDGEWILTDTYPDSDRMMTLMLYRVRDGHLVTLGRFYLPPEHTGEWRCDLHPRWNRAGTQICIDSMHSGQRQMYLLDVHGMVTSSSVRVAPNLPADRARLAPQLRYRPWTCLGQGRSGFPYAQKG